MTKKVGRPASSATKKSIGRLSKGRKGRKALSGDATVTITNRDQTQNSSDEDDNPGDTDISSEDEEGESEIELEPIVDMEEVGPIVEMEEVGLAGEAQDLETGRGISRFSNPSNPLVQIKITACDKEVFDAQGSRYEV